MISVYAAFQHTLQFRKGWQNIYMCDFLGIPKYFSEVSYIFRRIFKKLKVYMSYISDLNVYSTLS